MWILSDQDPPSPLECSLTFLCLHFSVCRPDVKLTGKLEPLWLKRDPELQGQIAWTYIGTMGGVMRIYPGVQMARGFDPTK